MQAYSDPARESDPHALPDLEVFRGTRYVCHNADKGCEAETVCEGHAPLCPVCSTVSGVRMLPAESGWFWWACSPGCLPDSGPFGPFATEAAALADARESAGE